MRFVQSLPAIVGAFLAAFSISAVVQIRADEAWKFVLPEAGAEHEYPPLRAIPLAGEKPDDLKEKAEYRGASRRYAQLRYGSPSAARVAIVVDQVSPQEVDLYVDVNRNRTIEAIERCSAEERLWRVPLNVEYAQREVFKRLPRELVFRLGSTGRTLSFAAAGYLAGEVPLEGRDSGVAARRMDGDGNGLFTDPQDRLWIDLNGDNRWDAVDEQFLYGTILAIGGQRYAVRSDERGTMLNLTKLEGTGTIALAVRQKPDKNSSEPGTLGRITEIAVTLVGRDGSAVGLRGTDAKATVPVGDYRVSAVSLSLDDPAGGQRWNFVFSDNGGRDDKRWHKLDRDAALAIDPLEKFDFSTGARQAKGECRPGDELMFQPKLFTIDGLLINTCYRGTHDTGRDGTCATIKLSASDGTLLATAQSGFA